jgi:tetratricopeptide (TPR) repeat protein
VRYNNGCSTKSTNNSNRHRSFWSPEALSPRIFNVPPPPKRSKSVRNYLVFSPRSPASATLTTRGRNRTIDGLPPNGSDAMSPVVLSPTARSVRSESLRRNYSYAALSSLPLFPSSSSMSHNRVQLAPAPSQLLETQHQQQQKQKQKPQKQQQRRQEEEDRDGDDGEYVASSSTRSKRRLVKTELDSPSKAWYEELDQIPSPASQKLSMDSRVSELEAQVQKLLAAKKQIAEALKKSQLQIHMARVEKDKCNAIARKYLGDGYAPCSPRPSSTRDSSDPAIDRISRDEGHEAEEEPVVSPYASSPSENNQDRETQDGGGIENADDMERSTVSEETLSNCIRPSSPLPAPRLSPFRSEKLELHIPLDVAATHHELGVILLGKCDFSSAAEEFHKSLEINGDNAIAWYHLAKALDGKGDQEAAERAVNKSLAIDARSLPSLSLLGRLLHLRGEHDKAIVVFRKALNLQCPPM